MKYPVEETVQKWADFDILGKIKYLLDQDKTYTKALDKLIKQVQEYQESLDEVVLIHIHRLEEKIDKHMSAHQALMSKPEAGKCKQ